MLKKMSHGKVVEMPSHKILVVWDRVKKFIQEDDGQGS